MNRFFVGIGAMLATVFLSATAFAQDSASPSVQDGTAVILSIDGTDYKATLYNTPAANELLARLPLALSLNRGGRDYCGGMNPVSYDQKQVQSGYRNGQLAYWIPGQDFVIFLEGEENGSSVQGVVPLGEMTDSFQPLLGLGRTIQVRIQRDR